MAIVLFDLLKKYINDTELAFMCVILAILIFATTQFWRHVYLPSPYGQYAQAFNSVLIGVFFANCYRIPKFIVAGCTLLLLASTIIWASNQSGVGIPYILSIIVMSLILSSDWNINSKIQVNGLSECALGVYLSHPFWGLVIAKMHLSSGVVFTFLVFLASGASIYLIKKYSPVTSKFII